MMVGLVTMLAYPVILGQDCLGIAEVLRAVNLGAPSTQVDDLEDDLLEENNKGPRRQDPNNPSILTLSWNCPEEETTWTSPADFNHNQREDPTLSWAYK